MTDLDYIKFAEAYGFWKEISDYYSNSAFGEILSHHRDAARKHMKEYRECSIAS